MILIIVVLGTLLKITSSNEGGGGVRQSSQTFLLRSIPSPEFQLLIKVSVCIVPNSNEFPGNITKMTLASSRCVRFFCFVLFCFKKLLLAALFRADNNCIKYVRFRGILLELYLNGIN